MFGMGTGGTLLPSSPEWFQAVVGAALLLFAFALRSARLLALASLVLARGVSASRFRFGLLFALFSDRFPLPASSYAPSKLHSEKLTSKTFFSFRSSSLAFLLPSDFIIIHSSVFSLQYSLSRSAYLLRTKLSTY